MARGAGLLARRREGRVVEHLLAELRHRGERRDGRALQSFLYPDRLGFYQQIGIVGPLETGFLIGQGKAERTDEARAAA